MSPLDPTTISTPHPASCVADTPARPMYSCVFPQGPLQYPSFALTVRHSQGNLRLFSTFFCVSSTIFCWAFLKILDELFLGATEWTCCSFRACSSGDSFMVKGFEIPCSSVSSITGEARGELQQQLSHGTQRE